jgi:hypothetical protein
MEHSMFSLYNACLRTQGDIISTSSELVTLSLSLIFFAALTIARIAEREPQLTGAWQRAKRAEPKYQQ